MSPATTGTDRRFDAITADTFAILLAQYPATVPSKIAGLEQHRLHRIPASVQARKPAHLTKDELVTLMEWKLAHGKFRPSLRKLVSENQPEHVMQKSEDGFRMYDSAKSLLQSSDAAEAKSVLKNAMDSLTSFRGVGPATASLLLSTYDQENVPFFSDELYRWAVFDDASCGQSIKYTLKAYLELYDRARQLRKRLGISALEAEKVAYVLGKSGGEVEVMLASTRKRKIEDGDESVETVEKPAVSRKTRKTRKKEVD
ncbi:hypothetical protein LTR62_007417 [Meristemomyces frigidus]|uniref:Uncharacterized protein n=1 Tax=Meristemomyces frigidus TaxID=1508187 RepID=A0AAN7TIC3_9PEZI|nr:hypothetical protein LTR62_007417 [Meristemomyces frigidus]